nr:zinc finger CCCH domain-containing protein 14 [Leptinotarsa decemlineata]
MDNVGAEVGQKMRSAIKAKLLELNCYADDELPDYIMVMVANKRTKSQMNDDLNLFLNTKTSTFVEWLHIVLKKLKEVTVTNPEVYKRVTKRKSNDGPDIKVKKEKKSSKKLADNIKREEDLKKSLTDNLPMNVNRLSDQRKIIVVSENKDQADDDFDIPLLSEVSSSSEADLKAIERKIRNVKSRLGITVDSDLETELQNIKSEKDTLENESLQPQGTSSENHRIVELESTNESEAEVGNEQRIADTQENMDFSFTPEKIRRHTPITFDEDPPPKRISILDRLGKKPLNDEADLKQHTSEYRRQEQHFPKRSGEPSSNEEEDFSVRRGDKKSNKERREERHSGKKRISSRRYSPEYQKVKSRKSENRNILGRLCVMSKIHVPQKECKELELEDELKTREVRSMVQVKPRRLPSNMQQPNKNLLLKAVAEAQKSVAQATNSGIRQALKRRLVIEDEDVPIARKLSHSEKVKLRNKILEKVSQTSSDDEEEREMYTPKPLKNVVKETPKYVPSSRNSLEEPAESEKKVSSLRPSIKSRLEPKKSPSPIVFDRLSPKVSNKLNVPDRLPIARPPLSIKNKERCKYWPSCRQGDKCEFVHPSANCEMFPNCRFGEKCIYFHPNCKFGTGCTKRDCPYNHIGITSTSSKLSIKLPVTQPQICKFFPKCTNITCSFYHPKLCKFGKYCKNQADCSYSHALSVSKTNLTWRSK